MASDTETEGIADPLHGTDVGVLRRFFIAREVGLAWGYSQVCQVQPRTGKGGSGSKGKGPGYITVIGAHRLEPDDRVPETIVARPVPYELITTGRAVSPAS